MSKAADKLKIFNAANGFMLEMNRAMIAAYEDGKRGWDDPQSPFWRGNFESEICRRLASMHGEEYERNEVDAANYLMMLWYLRKQRKESKP